MSDNGHKVVELPETLTVRHLAELLHVSPIEVIKQLMANGVMANINQQIDFDTAAVITQELGFEARLHKEEHEAPAAEAEAPAWRRALEGEDATQLTPRPPVVTILGHVDHGKTSLLDAIRSTDVAGGEAGGITQHIGAYQVLHKDRLITFLDTPGHAAFTAMRARGAQVTDIVILVVAADDGVMPQTREAYAHAKAASVPIVVALNKVDKPNANPDRVKQQLAELGLTPDDWGGDTMVVPVSAKKRTGIEDLLEAILLTADNTRILANPAGRVIGSVIEAELDHAKGPISTLLVQNGTVHVGDVLVAGTAHGKIRAMFDYRGQPIQAATPSMPATVLGLGLLYAETGNITENDIMLASASSAIVIGFNVQVDHVAQRAAESEHVSIRQYDIIYRLTEDVEKALKGLLGPEKREVVIGRAEVRAVFSTSRMGKVAGCYVREGELRRNARIRVMRGSQKLFEGEVASLRHEKDDVREIRQGFECGAAVKGFEGFQVGDLLECIVTETVQA
ncbi:MAG: translation initiation factor IF-2 [Chloroflexi bacterium]|nr:translation initiation factor IF-2 [Chloroflexota bacterium]